LMFLRAAFFCFAVAISMPLEVLYFSFMFFRGRARLERTQVLASSVRTLLARIQSVLTGFEFTDHVHAAFLC
jgi:hypothetical protein